MMGSALERHLAADGQLFFLHLQKTGGSSLNAIIEPHFERREIFCTFAVPDDLAEVRCQDAEAFRYFHGHLPYDLMASLLRPEALLITLLRDPVERFISHFYHRRRKARPQDPYARQLQQMNLAEFVQANDFILHRNFCNYQTRLLGTAFEADTPKQWLAAEALNERYRMQGDSGYQAPDVRLAQERLENCALVGLTERLQDTLFLLAYTLGWLPVAGMHHRNVNPDRPRRAQVAPEILERIAEINAADRELYAHARALFERRFSQMSWELLERYGRSQDALLEPPLPQDVLLELLETHYAQGLAERHRPVPAVHLRFDASICGAGWHLLGKNEPNRWSGPEKRSTLYLPAILLTQAGGDWVIRFCIVASITPQVLDSLSLQVNSRFIPLCRQSLAEGIIFTGYLPQAVIKGWEMTRLAFSVAHTLAPCELNPESNDRRFLGLAFLWLEIQPICQER